VLRVFVQAAVTVMQKEKSQFRVNLQHDSLNGPALVKMANTYWQLSWIGQTGPLTGETIAGKTGWTTKHLLRFDTDGRAMYTDVNTRACAYSEEPHYFTTMLGDSHFHLIRSAIRNCAPTITLTLPSQELSFRVQSDDAWIPSVFAHR
jgi:hypothetical protein